MNDRIVLLDELGEEQEFIILATFGLDDESCRTGKSGSLK